jgi:3-oxoacyl-(acyl-carrier-protein) synthase
MFLRRVMTQGAYARWFCPGERTTGLNETSIPTDRNRVGLSEVAARVVIERNEKKKARHRVLIPREP